MPVPAVAETLGILPNAPNAYLHRRMSNDLSSETGGLQTPLLCDRGAAVGVAFQF